MGGPEYQANNVSFEVGNIVRWKEPTGQRTANLDCFLFYEMEITTLAQGCSRTYIGSIVRQGYS